MLETVAPPTTAFTAATNLHHQSPPNTTVALMLTTVPADMPGANCHDTSRYCCVVWTERDATDEQLAALDVVKELVIKQDTPIRVLHRRTGMVRPRTVHWMRTARIKPHYFKVWLNTAAGT
jgi:tRNA pseudouridine synthase 10